MSRRVGTRAAILAPLAAVLAVAAVLAGPVADVDPVDAQAQNRAAVIVHTGGGSAAVCVRFDEPTITGLDALQRAGLGAVVRSFSGQGSAVCGINGVGCPADDSCLTCRAPDYWAYHKASPGAAGFTFSSVGAGSTQVADGSVEGWQWGTGAAPPFQTVDQVCGAAAPAPAPVPAPQVDPQAGPAPSAAGGGDGPTPGAPGASTQRASPTTDAVATTTTAVTATTDASDDRAAPGAGDATAAVEAELAAANAAADDGGGDDDGSPWAAALFVALVAGIGGAAVVIRRRRAD